MAGELERLAEEGRQKQAQHAAIAQTSISEEQERQLLIALGGHFGTPIKRLFRNLHFVSFAVLAAGLYLTVSKTGPAATAEAVTTAGFIPSFVLLFLRAFWTPKATDGQRAQEQSWYQALPFALTGYFEALRQSPLPHCRLRILLQFASQRAPTAELFAGIVLRVDPGATPHPPAVGWSASPISGHTGIKVNNVRIYRNHRIVKYVHDVVEQVLLPLHREYPLQSVHIQRDY